MSALGFLLVLVATLLARAEDPSDANNSFLLHTLGKHTSSSADAEGQESARDLAAVLPKMAPSKYCYFQDG